jgi:hypothetical protein
MKWNMVCSVVSLEVVENAPGIASKQDDICWVIVG